MRKLKYCGTLASFSIVACMLSIQSSVPTFAQTASSGFSTAGAAILPNPTDLNALMLLAAKSNGILAEDISPWHLKAAFQLFDEQGKVEDQGTIEEFWAAKDKNRLTYTSAGYKQTTYSTDHGSFRSGDKQAPSYFVTEMRNQFVQPFPEPILLQHQPFDLKQMDAGTFRVDCLTLKPSALAFAVPEIIGRTYCLESGKPVLRLAFLTQNGNQCLRDNISIFEGRSVPIELRIMFGHETVASATIDTLEHLTAIKDADFAPPSGATPVPRRIMVSGGVEQGLLRRSVTPEYPESAKKAGISGVVVLLAVIGVDGHPLELRPMSGPPELRHAAIVAASGFLYKPYQLNGEPVEVITNINIAFSLGHR